MDKLPSDILTLIFQFDPTYHEQYKQVLLELYSRAKWKIVWINVVRPPEYTHDERYRDRIIHYCEKDVVATIQLFRKYQGEPLIDNEFIQIV